jgi:hypothetical protein
MRRRVLLGSALIVALTWPQVAERANGAIIAVSGTASIFGAGHAIAPGPGGGGGGTLPPYYSFDAGPGKWIQFTDVSGVVSPNAPLNTWCGPDGLLAAPSATDIESYGGISGIVFRGTEHGRAFFLTGVFLDDNAPDDAHTPERLDFSFGGDSFEILAPKIGQTFFIGDGLTGTGTGLLQTFIVPRTATRLFLGFADAPYFLGLPGAYRDNAGYLEVQLNTILIPEPASLAVWSVLAVAGTAFGRRRRRTR